MMTKDELQVLHKNYLEWSRNKPPSERITPTAAQLTALKYLVDQGEVPYVDFGVWTWNQKALEKYLYYQRQVPNLSGRAHHDQNRETGQ